MSQTQAGMSHSDLEAKEVLESCRAVEMAKEDDAGAAVDIAHRDEVVEITELSTSYEEPDDALERTDIFVTAAVEVEAVASRSRRREDEYVTARRKLLQELRGDCETEEEFEMQKTREHWTVVGDPCSADDLLNVANRQHFQRLVVRDIVSRSRLLGLPEVFRDFGDELVVGEKIGEGGQAEIFKAAIDGVDEFVLKVFKAGFSLADLERQWTLKDKNGNYLCDGSYAHVAPYCDVRHATLLKNGRLAFVMRRYWGDLRKLIDYKLKDKNGCGSPFRSSESRKIMFSIAMGMDTLHRSGVLHRDLKAANVLMRLAGDYVINAHVADFDSSLGVQGTGFWRAPEILLALKERRVADPEIWTEKVDVYSFAMTCYEVLTGRIPFGDLKCTPKNYDVVIRGERPHLPDYVDSKLQELLGRCWHSDPLERPSFQKILDELYLDDPVMTIRIRYGEGFLCKSFPGGKMF